MVVNITEIVSTSEPKSEIERHGQIDKYMGREREIILEIERYLENETLT